MATGQTIATNTLTKLGLNQPSGTPSISDSNYALTELNNMWSSWSIDEGLIYAVTSAQYPLTAYVQSYSIGASGADFTAPRPARIYKAIVVSAKSFSATTQSTKVVLVADTTGLAIGQMVSGAGVPANSNITALSANTSITISQTATASASVTLVATGLNRNELKIVEAGAYYAHNDLGASAATPEELYPDYNADSGNLARLYLWPVASEFQPSYLELETGVAFSVWTLSDNYNLDAGYQDAIEWALAFRLLSGFGAAVQPQVAQVVQIEGVKAEARLRKQNAFTRQLPEAAIMAPGAQAQAPAQGA